MRSGFIYSPSRGDLPRENEIRNTDRVHEIHPDKEDDAIAEKAQEPQRNFHLAQLELIDLLVYEFDDQLRDSLNAGRGSPI